jgi:MFS family permease
MPEPALVEPAPAAHRPAWLRLAPFLGRAPELSARQWQVLGLVSVATLFDQYDRALFSMALPQIQQGLSIAESHVGLLGSIVRLGSLPAFGIVLAADRLGRRRLLLITVVAYTVLTGLTAFAPDARSFVALQFLGRAFTTAEVLLAIVVISEELPAEQRGWGIGALFAIQSLGVGLAALLLPLVDRTPLGWRALYLVGLVPLLALAHWRRSLPETERFERHREHLEQSGDAFSRRALSPVLSLVRAYPGRFAALCAVVFCGALGGAAPDFYGPKYLQDAHGWAPADVTLLFIAGGALGIAGATFCGWWSDRFGRRRAAIVLGSAVVGLALVFYNVRGAWLAPVWIAMIFTLIGNDAVLSTYSAEVFPTSYRSTATGARMVVATLAAGIGLALESLLYGRLGSHWTATSWLLGISLGAPLLVALFFPETAGRSLEDISPERALEVGGPDEPAT